MLFRIGLDVGADATRGRSSENVKFEYTALDNMISWCPPPLARSTLGDELELYSVEECEWLGRDLRTQLGPDPVSAARLGGS